MNTCTLVSMSPRVSEKPEERTAESLMYVHSLLLEESGLPEGAYI